MALKIFVCLILFFFSTFIDLESTDFSKSHNDLKIILKYYAYEARWQLRKLIDIRPRIKATRLLKKTVSRPSNSFVVKLLIYGGGALDSIDIHGKNNLHWAAIVDNHKLFKDLYKISENRWDSKGYLPVHYAARGGYILSVKALLNLGDRVDSYTYEGQQLLHLAARSSNFRLIDFLISQHSNLYAYDHQGFLPIHYAALSSRQSVATLLRHDYSLIDIKLKGGSRLAPVYLALTHNKKEIVKYLILQGADIFNQKNVNTIFYLDYYPDIREAYADLVSKEWKYFLNQDTRNTYGALQNTVVHWAMLLDEIEYIKNIAYLKRACLNIKNSQGYTPLELAVHKNRIKSIKSFISYFDYDTKEYEIRGLIKTIGRLKGKKLLIKKILLKYLNAKFFLRTYLYIPSDIAELIAQFHEK